MLARASGHVGEFGGAPDREEVLEVICYEGQLEEGLSDSNHT